MSPPAPGRAAGGSAFSNSAQAPWSTNDSGVGVGGDNCDDHSMNYAAAAAAATLTPYTAARSFHMGAASRSGSWPRRSFTVEGLSEIVEGSRGRAGEATTTKNDVENPQPTSQDRLMEDVPAESRIVLEFRELSCFVPQLFLSSSGAKGGGGGGGSGGAGAGGDVMRSATALGPSPTQRKRPAGSSGDSTTADSTKLVGSSSVATAASSSSSKATRQVSRQTERGRERERERERERGA